MLANAVRITLRLMMFRSGPQDFPYSNQATQIVAPLAVLANFLQFRFTLPPTPALVQAVVSLATLVCAVLLLLRTRAPSAMLIQSAATGQRAAAR